MRMKYRGRDTKRLYCRLAHWNLGNLPTKASTKPDISRVINRDHMRCDTYYTGKTVLLDSCFRQCACRRWREATDFGDVILCEPDSSIWCQCNTIWVDFRCRDSCFNRRMQLRIELTNRSIGKISEP